MEEPVILKFIVENDRYIKTISINMSHCIPAYPCMHYISMNNDHTMVKVMTSHSIVNLLNGFGIETPQHFIDNDMFNCFNKLSVKNNVSFKDECIDSIMEDECTDSIMKDD